MTKLEKEISSRLGFLGSGLNQKELDIVTEVIMSALSPADIVNSMQEVYDETAKEYAENKHTRDVIDELLMFMAMLPDGAMVLDVGCGPGRDAFFMSVKDEEFREGLMYRTKDGMKTHEKFVVPTKTFQVTAIDGSLKMLDVARERREVLIKANLLTHEAAPAFCFEDMHNIDSQDFGPYEGAWSCAALFTHTPRELLKPAMESVARVLKPRGLFFTSYTNGLADSRYNKLLLSSTGRVKYFSQPDPDEITRVASTCGLKLEKESFSDFEVSGKVLKENLFVSQFFRKE